MQSPTWELELILIAYLKELILVKAQLNSRWVNIEKIHIFNFSKIANSQDETGLIIIVSIIRTINNVFLKFESRTLLFWIYI